MGNIPDIVKFILYTIFAVHAGILVLTLLLFARHEADWSWYKAGMVAFGFTALMGVLNIAAMTYWPGWMLWGLVAIHSVGYVALAIAICYVFFVSRFSAVICALTAGTLWKLVHLWLCVTFNAAGMNLDYAWRGGRFQDREYCVALLIPEMNEEFAPDRPPGAKFQILQYRFRDMARDASATSNDELIRLVEESGREVRRLLSKGELHRFERLHLLSRFQPFFVEFNDLGDPPVVGFRIPNRRYEMIDFLDPIKHDRDRKEILALIRDEWEAIDLLMDPNLEIQRWGMEWILSRPAPPAGIPDAAVKNVIQSFLARHELSKTQRVTYYGALDTAKTFLTRYGGVAAEPLLGAP